MTIILTNKEMIPFSQITTSRIIILFLLSTSTRSILSSSKYAGAICVHYHMSCIIIDSDMKKDGRIERTCPAQPPPSRLCPATARRQELWIFVTTACVTDFILLIYCTSNFFCSSYVNYIIYFLFQCYITIICNEYYLQIWLSSVEVHCENRKYF